MKSTTNNNQQKRQSDSARIYSLELGVQTHVDLSEIIPQVDMLHQKISSVEWSGILFYKIYDTEGNEIEEPSEIMEKDTILKTKYILPLNKGSASYTEYETDMETLIDLTKEQPELENCIRGHIHSHVNMSTFFSGTDTDQLKDGAFDNEMFLSVIVNQKDDVTARVSFKGKVDTSPKVTLYQKEVDLAQSYEDAVFYIEPEVYDIEREEPESFFEKQLQEITKPKTTYTQGGYSNGYYTNPAYNKGNQSYRNNYRNANKTVGRTEHEKTADLKKRAINILTGLVEKSVSGNLSGTQKQKVATGMLQVLEKGNWNMFITTLYLNAEERFNGLLGTSIIDEFSDLEEMNDHMADILVEVARGSTPNGGIITIDKKYEDQMMPLAREIAQTLTDALEDVMGEITINSLSPYDDGYNRPF